MSNYIYHGGLKKCIVLDLDNTLWGGIVGEDGLNGIKLGLSPPGSYFVAFQQALIDLYNQGIILAVNSKNNFNDIMAVISTHPNMILKEHHFAALRINWDDKVKNLRELAQELNIGLDSMVFLDDDPVNRLLVRTILPEVEVPDLPEDPKQFVKFLQSLPYFRIEVVTDEDKMRGSFYVTERLRKEHEKKFTLPKDFLKSLETEVHSYLDDPVCAPRLAQLTAKTNQFNTNKQPMSEDEIRRYVADPKYAVFHAEAKDRFGNHGIIAFALVNKIEQKWIIESLLVSCRVLGRGIEEAFLESIRKSAMHHGAEWLEIVFSPTAKNQPAKNFVEKHFNEYTLPVAKEDFMPGWVRLHANGEA